MVRAWAGMLASMWIVQFATAEPLKSGIDLTGFDRTVRLQDDLFLHVNGEWLKHTPIPDDKSNYGSFTILSDEALLKLRAIIDDAASGDHPTGSDEQKIGDFYRSFMDEATVEQRGIEPLRSELQAIAQLASVAAVVQHFGQVQPLGINTPIGFFVDQDDKNSVQYLAAVVQSGTTLPDRDYYLEDDPKYLKARDALRTYVRTLYQLAELAEADAAADAVLAVETKLAEVQWERTERCV